MILISTCNLQSGQRLSKCYALCLIAMLTLNPNSLAAQEIFDVSKSSTGRVIDQQSQSIRTFPTLSMLVQYRGEEHKGVHYLNDEERDLSLLHICDGLLCDSQGHLLNPKFVGPRTRMTSFPEQPKADKTLALGFAIYVMDATGKIWVSFGAKVNKFHHSSFLKGQPVAAAGEMIIFQGRIYAINNRSGHYHPPPVVIKRVLQTLKSNGVSTQGILIKEYGSDF